MSKHDSCFWYISVAGVMGSGKTTASRLLSRDLQSRLLEENVEGNFFLPLYYQDKKRWALHAQLFYLREKVAQLWDIRSLLQDTHVVHDSPLYQDYLTYAKAQQVLGNMSEQEFALYEKYFHALNRDLPTPDLIVELRASTPILADRIKKRARGFEQQVDLAYLDLLSSLQREWIAQHSHLNTLVIDTDNIDLESNADDQKHFVSSVLAHLETLKPQALPLERVTAK